MTPSKVRNSISASLLTVEPLPCTTPLLIRRTNRSRETHRCSDVYPSRRVRLVVAAKQEAVLRQAYRLFNDRQIDDLLALMTDDVEWPDVANGAVLHGKDEIRPYWEGQFAVADPRVVPIEFMPAGDDVVVVVDQRVLDLQGQSLA